MATGEPGHDPYFYIFPDTAVFTGSDSVGNVFSSSTLYKDTYNNVPCYKLSYNSSNSITITINAYGHTYTASSYFGSNGDNIVLNLPTQNLYAWDGYNLKGTATGDVYYTLTDTITSNEPCYDEYGQAITNRWITPSGDLQGA